MRVVKGLDGLKKIRRGAVLSVGNFDGVHLGHRKLLELGREWKEKSGGELVLVTFEPHPLTVLRPEKAPPRLSPAVLKHELLEGEGVDYLVELPPTQEVLNLTAEEFWRVLKDEVGGAHIIEGEDFNFGKGRGGNIQKLREWAEGSSLRLHVIEPVKVVLLDMQEVPVSSTLIRFLLSNGRVRDTAICLGRNYVLEGEVVRGFERGRTIGVPTINLDCGDQLVPMDGVYAGRCMAEGKMYAAAVSVGTMPTFGENKRQVEAHLIGFEGDLYGNVMHLEMVDWLRDQWKFESVEGLKRQLGKDIEESKSLVLSQ